MMKSICCPRCPLNGTTAALRACVRAANFTVDIEWRNGKLISTTIHSLAGNPSEVRYGDVTRKPVLKKGAVFRWNGEP